MEWTIHEHWTIRAADDLVGHAAENRAAKAASPVGRECYHAYCRIACQIEDPHRGAAGYRAGRGHHEPIGAYRVGEAIEVILGLLLREFREMGVEFGDGRRKIIGQFHRRDQLNQAQLRAEQTGHCHRRWDDSLGQRRSVEGHEKASHPESGN